ncbi:MAG: glutamate-5-semialdehyde dehydrogenase [Spirochaetota bacterium]|nr:glutamate-5-semialdehyde dehydrogenase [Spirochaetota bacterium]OPZ38262.1 MAG: Gamma-glutamyl phosphate reductase [Spirochaetes bacterium ADurb.BinA120]HPI14230.1 glutamate-5-semialdehyde dehydrogenase [Spirochaetota bacterium]
MERNSYIESLCKDARNASRFVARLSSNERNAALRAMARRLRAESDYILAENARDVAVAKNSGQTGAFIDRLLLDKDRIGAMARSIEDIALFEDPIGRIENMRTMPSGIRVGQMRVPLGVVCVIFESRPNVMTDIAALCLKSGNACVLRGGKESINSNIALQRVISASLEEVGVPHAAVTLVEKTDRALVPVLLKMNSYIDIVIPRGGESLIQAVVKDSTIPVIKHDKGVCHAFVDRSADPDMAVNICLNAKVQRPGVCNAIETLLVHREYPHARGLLLALSEKGVELRGCPETVAILPETVIAANEDDWYAEYLDLILAVRIVGGIDEAMEHIQRYGSGHSEAIITGDYAMAERFLAEVDSAAVMVNASPRFHDGGEFGLGAEVGISTQKLHARGTMGIGGLTCLKYVVYGSGQVRS